MKDEHSISDAELAEACAGEGPHLITVAELRAAGALDVPAAWRKSLGEERDLFSALIADDENPEKQQPVRVEPDNR